jgi:hypothetical protein
VTPPAHVAGVPIEELVAIVVAAFALRVPTVARLALRDAWQRRRPPP